MSLFHHCLNSYALRAVQSEHRHNYFHNTFYKSPRPSSNPIICIYTHTYTYIYTQYKYLYIHICVCVCVFIYKCIYIYIYVYIYLYIHICLCSGGHHGIRKWSEWEGIVKDHLVPTLLHWPGIPSTRSGCSNPYPTWL